MSEMIEVARSSVQTWECDQMGHMNVQFYVEKAGQGLAALSLALGLGPRYARNEGARLFVRDHHVRFLREQRPGAPFFLRAGVLEVRDFGLRVYEEMVSTVSGEPAASFIAEVELLDEETREVKPLPAKAKEAAKKLVGVDVFLHVDWDEFEPYELAAGLLEAPLWPLRLDTIASRGLKIWPDGAPQTMQTDHCRCRFMAADRGHAITHHDVVTLLARLADRGFDFIQTAHLYEFDGERGFSLAQGQ